MDEIREIMIIRGKGASVKDTLRMLAEREEVEDVTLFADLRIPDNIARAFLSRYPLEQLMYVMRELEFCLAKYPNSIRRKDIENDLPVFVEYTYNDVPWHYFAYKYGYPETHRQLTSGCPTTASVMRSVSSAASILCVRKEFMILMMPCSRSSVHLITERATWVRLITPLYSVSYRDLTFVSRKVRPPSAYLFRAWSSWTRRTVRIFKRSLMWRCR